MRTFVICCLLAFPVAAQDAVTNAPAVKAKVAPAAAAVAPRIAAAAVKPVAMERVSVPDSPEALEAEAASATAPLSIEAALAKANAADVPRIVEAAIAKASAADVPRIVEAAIAKANAADVPRIVAAIVATMERVSVPDSPEELEAHAATARVAETAVEVYAKLYTLSEKAMPPEKLLELKVEWFQTFVARGGSKMWWILRRAREMAERGEPVDRLKAAFDATLSAWMAEEE